MPDSHGAPEETNGSLAEGQRADTAPLKRDPSRVNPDSTTGTENSDPTSVAASAEGAPGETTRPAFQQPARGGTPAPPNWSFQIGNRGGTGHSAPGAAGHQPTNQAGPMANAHPPYGQPPTGQQPFPGQQPAVQPRAQSATTATPVAQLAQGDDESDKITPAGWALRALVLVAVSLVSGILWYAIKPDSQQPEAGSGQNVPPTKYHFDQLRREETNQSCKDVSNDKIRQFFAKSECDHLTRALYTVTLPTGQRVLTSVTTVRMPDAATAQQLNSLVTRDGTGNIRDLVDEGRPGLDGYPGLGDHAYGSGLQGRLVAIGDSAYFGRDTPDKDPQALEVTRDALQLAWPQDQDPTP